MVCDTRRLRALHPRFGVSGLSEGEAPAAGPRRFGAREWMRARATPNGASALAGCSRNLTAPLRQGSQAVAPGERNHTAMHSVRPSSEGRCPTEKRTQRSLLREARRSSGSCRQPNPLRGGGAAAVARHAAALRNGDSDSRAGLGPSNHPFFGRGAEDPSQRPDKPPFFGRAASRTADLSNHSSSEGRPGRFVGSWRHLRRPEHGRSSSEPHRRPAKRCGALRSTDAPKGANPRLRPSVDPSGTTQALATPRLFGTRRIGTARTVSERIQAQGSTERRTGGNAGTRATDSLPA